MHKSRLVAALLCVLVIFVPLAGHAKKYTLNEAPVAAIDDQEVRDRLAFIEGAFEETNSYQHLWWRAWTGIFAGAMVGHAAWALAINEPGHDAETGYLMSGRQIDLTVGLATTILGVGSMFVFPYPQRYALRRIRAMPNSTPEERVARYIQAEEYLNNSANSEIRGKAWTQYMITVAVTLSTGAILWGGFDLMQFAIPRAAMGSTVGVIKILTMSRQSYHAWQQYSEIFGAMQPVAGLEPNPYKPPVNWAVTPTLLNKGAGLTAGLQF